jgi:hypothetical protein
MRFRAKKAASTLSKGLSFALRAHDLRRTAASYMAEAGVDRFHIAHVLHRSVTHSTVTAIYDRYRYDKEKRTALETWARLLESIVKPVGQLRRETRARSGVAGATGITESCQEETQTRCRRSAIDANSESCTTSVPSTVFH